MLRRLGQTLLLCTWGWAGCACATPKPKAPEAVAQLAQKKNPSPLIVKLKLNERTADKVEDLFSKVRGYTQGYEAARIALINEALPQIESGQLDYNNLKPLSDRAIAEWEAIVPRLARDANILHALLTPKQRKRLVKILGGGDPDLSEEEKRQAREERIVKLLDLNAGQKTRVFGTLVTLTVSNYSLVSDTRAAIAEAKEAFIQDEYDARKLKVVTQLDLHAIAELAYEALEDGLEILTPQQRLTLVAIMKARLLQRTTESAKPPSEPVSAVVVKPATAEAAPPPKDKQREAPVDPVDGAIEDPSALAPKAPAEAPQEPEEAVAPEPQEKTVNPESK